MARMIALLALATAQREVLKPQVETSYPAGGPARPQDLVGFPPSPAGQLAYVHALRATLREALPAAQNGGFLWWEETEGADDSLFDAHYVARPALRHGFATPSRRHGEN